MIPNDTSGNIINKFFLARVGEKAGLLPKAPHCHRPKSHFSPYYNKASFFRHSTPRRCIEGGAAMSRYTERTKKKKRGRFILCRSLSPASCEPARPARSEASVVRNVNRSLCFGYTAETPGFWVRACCWINGLIAWLRTAGGVGNTQSGWGAVRRGNKGGVTALGLVRSQG